jgi:ArsR family transcriptional regulator, arsenate/arsenite/antimonite-responsive transcriptional repressor
MRRYDGRMNPPPADPLVLLKAIADPVRWQALQFLHDPSPSACSQDEQGVCACDFEGVLGLSQPTVSHHMRQLVDAGLVRGEKRGRWVFYEIVPEGFEALRVALAGFLEPPAGAAAASTCGCGAGAVGAEPAGAATTIGRR